MTAASGGLNCPTTPLFLPAGTNCNPGDGDRDGDVDLVDYEALAGCLGGPGAGRGAPCQCFGFDGDGDVDLADFAGFQSVFGN